MTATQPATADLFQAVFESLAEVYIPDGADTAAKPECNCHFVDIGIGTQKAAEDPGCPRCTPHGYVEWLTGRLMDATASPLAALLTRGPHRAADTGAAPALNTALPTLKGLTDRIADFSEQLDAFEWLALNAEKSFRAVAVVLVPGFQPSTWDDYALAVQDLWDLNTGSDPFPYCPDEVDHHRFSAAEARAFAIDDRTERRDSALARLLDAIREAP